MIKSRKDEVRNEEDCSSSVVVAVMLLAGAVMAEAQQAGKIPRIGFLATVSFSTISDRVEAFRQGLRELGYVEEKTIVIEYRSAEGRVNRLLDLATELVRLKMEVIVTSGPTPTRFAQEATVTIPIVMAQVGDPVGNGFVASLARPAGTLQDCPAFPGAKRKTTGASEGDRSQALPRGRTRNFDQPRQRTVVKRNGTRRRGVRSDASIPRRARSQGY